MSSLNQSSVLHKFKEILFSTMSSEGLLNSLDSFNAREDDVFLVSYPKSGTHWIAKVIENIPNAEITLTSPIELGYISKFEELKMCCKRRVIPTHLNYNMLPMDIKQKQCKHKENINNVSESEVNQIASKSSFREMKNDAAKENGDPNKTICALTSNKNLVFRKGAVGDWINYFTSKQKRVFDELFTEKMKHSELARHFEDYS
uniref:Sulfotransferase n=1 Tax=Molossus molossus TaxID=27622 RepID=A0A7J8FYJ0_MOLMO|nr:hypothetical protein HJG59_008189 [Molossus molossus]